MSDKRTQLEQAAIAAVQRSGLQNLSFRTLAEQVGIKSSSVHYYFPEKGDLARVLIQEYTRILGQRLADIDQQAGALKQKLDGFVAIFEEVARGDSFCLCGMLAAEVATLSEQNRQLLTEFFVAGERWLENLLSTHQEQLTSPMEPRTLARLIMSGLEGAILLDRVNASTDRLQAHREMLGHLTG